MRTGLPVLRKRWRKPSEQRKYLWVATLEGFPAILLFQLLGGPFLTGYLLHIGAAAEEIGFVLALTTLVNVAQIGMALVMQKLRNRRITLLLLGGMHRLLWAATGLVPFLAPKEAWVPLFIVLYTIAFLANAGGGVVWASLVSDMVPAQVRGRYFGIRNTMLWGAGCLALYAGGQILKQAPGGAGFHILFSICGVCAVLNIAAFWFYPNLPFEPSAEANPLKMIRKPFQDAQFVRAIVFLSVWLFLQGVAVPFFSFVMLQVMHLGYETVANLTMAQNVAMMAGYYMWGRLNARYTTKTLLLWTLPVIAASCVVWAGVLWLPGLLVLALAHVLLGVGTGGFNQLVFNFITGDTPKSERPMYIAAYNALTGFAAFLGPMAGGALYKWLGGAPLWTQEFGVALAVGVLLLALALLFGRRLFREPQEPSGLAGGSRRTERRISA
jgi:MFS family permease